MGHPSVIVRTNAQHYKVIRDDNGLIMYREYIYNNRLRYITKRWADKGNDYWGFYDEDTGKEMKCIFTKPT